MGFCVVPDRVYQDQKTGGWRQHPARGFPDAPFPEGDDRGVWRERDGVAIILAQSRAVDIDLDDDTTAALAPHFLRPTATFGRDSRPRTHWVYRLPDEAPDGKRLVFHGFTRAVSVEIRRGRGWFTHGPGTRRGWGTEEIEWTRWDVDPALAPVVPWDEGDTQRVRELAVCALVADGLPPGARHEIIRCAAGVLRRAGWDEDRAARVLLIAAGHAGDDELADRERAIRDTWAASRVQGTSGLLAAGWPETAVKALVFAAGGTDGTDRPTVNLGERPDSILDKVIEVLAAPECPADVWEHGGAVVRSDLSSWRPAGLRVELHRWCRFVRSKDEGEADAQAPRSLGEEVLEAAGRLRHIRGRWPLPVLRSNGDVVTTEGWDRETGLWLTKEAGSIGRIGTSKEEAEAAALTLLDAVDGALWDDPDRDPLAWLAHCLTVVARPVIDGPVPVWMYTANVPRSGKTTLAQIAGDLASSPALGNVPVTGRVDALEVGRLLDDGLGRPAYVIDNLRGRVDFGPLEQLLTGGELVVRRLHVGPVRLGLLGTLALTGNGIEVTPDLAARSIPVRLARTRAGALTGDRLLELRPRRAELAAAALTIVRAYLLASPGLRARGVDAMTTELSGFAAWSTIVAGALRWLGLGDVVAATREVAEDAAVASDDADAVEVYEALAAVLATRPDGRARPVDLLGTGDIGPAWLRWRLLANELAGMPPNAARLSRRLLGMEPGADGRRVVRVKANGVRYLTLA